MTPSRQDISLSSSTTSIPAEGASSNFPHLKIRLTPVVTIDSELVPKKPRGKALEEAVDIVPSSDGPVKVIWAVNAEALEGCDTSALENELGAWIACNKEHLGIDRVRWVEDTSLDIFPASALPLQSPLTTHLIPQGAPVAELTRLTVRLSWVIPKTDKKRAAPTDQADDADHDEAGNEESSPSSSSLEAPHEPRTAQEVATEQLKVGMRRVLRMQFIRRFPFVFDGELLNYQHILAPPPALHGAIARFLTTSSQYATPLATRGKAALRQLQASRKQALKARAATAARVPPRATVKRGKNNDGSQVTPPSSQGQAEEDIVEKVLAHMDGLKLADAEMTKSAKVERAVTEALAIVGVAKWTASRRRGKMMAGRAKLEEDNEAGSRVYHDIVPSQVRAAPNLDEPVSPRSPHQDICPSFRDLERVYKSMRGWSPLNTSQNADRDGHVDSDIPDARQHSEYSGSVDGHQEEEYYDDLDEEEYYDDLDEEDYNDANGSAPRSVRELGHQRQSQLSAALEYYSEVDDLELEDLDHEDEATQRPSYRRMVHRPEGSYIDDLSEEDEVGMWAASPARPPAALHEDDLLSEIDDLDGDEVLETPQDTPPGTQVRYSPQTSRWSQSVDHFQSGAVSSSRHLDSPSSIWASELEFDDLEFDDLEFDDLDVEDRSLVPSCDRLLEPDGSSSVLRSQVDSDQLWSQLSSLGLQSTLGPPERTGDDLGRPTAVCDDASREIYWHRALPNATSSHPSSHSYFRPPTAPRAPNPDHGHGHSPPATSAYDSRRREDDAEYDGRRTASMRSGGHQDYRTHARSARDAHGAYLASSSYAHRRRDYYPVRSQENTSWRDNLSNRPANPECEHENGAFGQRDDESLVDDLDDDLDDDLGDHVRPADLRLRGHQTTGERLREPPAWSPNWSPSSLCAPTRFSAQSVPRQGYERGVPGAHYSDSGHRHFAGGDAPAAPASFGPEDMRSAADMRNMEYDEEDYGSYA